MNENVKRAQEALVIVLENMKGDYAIDDCAIACLLQKASMEYCKQALVDNKAAQSRPG